jgi:hypothetical protein
MVLLNFHCVLQIFEMKNEKIGANNSVATTANRPMTYSAESILP